MFSPKIDTKSIMLTPPVRSVSLDILTGQASCGRFGNGHTGLTGGTDRSDRWTPSLSKIGES
jgi:hypothetical protein